MKRTTCLAVVVLLLSARPAAAETLEGKVVRVAGGDKLVVAIDDRERTFTLAGLVAPTKPTALVEKAKKNLAAKVADQEVRIQVLGKESKWSKGAAPAAVWLGDRSINTEMVREGWAWHDPAHPEYKQIAQAQREAKAAERGLWAEPNVKPPWEENKDGAGAKPDKPETRELAIDDGRPASKRSLPQGMAVKFKTPEGKWVLKQVRIHGSRYGHPTPPREDFHVTVCDLDYKPLAEFAFRYSMFKRTSEQTWVALKTKPTELPKEFILCVDFKAEPTKGVYVSHDGEGTALVGRPNQPAGTFSGGDWLIRAVIERQ